MKALGLLLGFLISVAGCATILALTDNAAQRTARAIQEYCTLPAESRQLFREQVSKYAAPHSAAITCSK